MLHLRAGPGGPPATRPAHRISPTPAFAFPARRGRSSRPRPKARPTGGGPFFIGGRNGGDVPKGWRQARALGASPSPSAIAGLSAGAARGISVRCTSAGFRSAGRRGAGGGQRRGRGPVCAHVPRKTARTLRSGRRRLRSGWRVWSAAGVEPGQRGARPPGRRCGCAAPWPRPSQRPRRHLPCRCGRLRSRLPVRRPPTRP